MASRNRPDRPHCLGARNCFLNILAEGLDSSGSPSSVKGASFRPDGKALLVSSSDSITRISPWEMFAPLDELLALGRTRVTRHLTADEKRKYLHEVIDDQLPPNQ